MTSTTRNQTLLKTLLTNTRIIKTKHQAKQLHAQLLLTSNLNLNSTLHTSTLISIYSSFNLLHHSLTLFNTLLSLSLSPPPLLAWKSLIRCYTNLNLNTQALSCFNKMRQHGMSPDHNVFPSTIKSSALLMDLRLGQSIHGCVISLGLEFDLYIGNALMNMYLKFQTLVANQNQFNVGIVFDEMTKIFKIMPNKNVVTWNIVISGYAQNGMYEEALTMVRAMGGANLKPSPRTLSIVLPIFAEIHDVSKGKEIHGYVIRKGFDADVFIGSGLIDMYAKCNRVNDLYNVFNRLPHKDIISWNSVIAGSVRNGRFDQGLELFRQMLKAKITPKPVTFSSLMPACAHLTTLHLGKQLHGYIIRSGIDDNCFVASSLVDMYGKCGQIRVARLIFNQIQQHDEVSWAAIIMGYALHGSAGEAIYLFEQMKNMDGVKPNYVAFVAVLMACNYAGLVDEAWRYFDIMKRVYGIAPGIEHYVTIADLLGRVGKLEEAYEFISNMHIEPTASIWSTLLAACRGHKNVDLAEKVTEKIFKVDPEHTGVYVLMSNIYSAAQQWDDAENLRISMRKNGMKKKSPACSWTATWRLHIAKTVCREIVVRDNSRFHHFVMEAVHVEIIGEKI
ncbi:hypothetical protein ACFE04_014037 [Oxalis oulophora]